MNRPTYDIHAQVEELLPFFVAGTLSAQESDFVRQHLSACPRCKQSLTEWFEIAHAVRTEAASWSTKLPPLSPRVRARLRSSSKSSKNNGARFNRLSVTLAAAMITVVFIGGLLLSDRNKDDSTKVAAAPTHTQTVISPTFTAVAVDTIAPAASNTPTLTIPTLDPALQPPIASATRIAPTDTPLAKLPPDATATPRPATITQAPLLPTPTEGFGLMIAESPTATPPTGCVAVPFQPGDVYLYAGPSTSYNLLWITNSEAVLIVNGHSDNGWYQVSFMMQDAIRDGWISSTLFYITGPYCSMIPLLPTPPLLEPTSTPVIEHSSEATPSP